MKPPLKRLKPRDLMIAVLAFALSLKLGLAYRHSANYWREAEFYARALVSARYTADLLEVEEKPGREEQAPVIPKGGVVMEVGISNLKGDERKRTAERSRNFADHLGRMQDRYRRAAFLPWLPNTPEPPES